MLNFTTELSYFIWVALTQSLPTLHKGFAIILKLHDTIKIFA
ncbi:hypothetical protein [uncultured Gammaproteobacteria bacterium]|nr:hypothetical protein [uncultured Gammaproteobacteria bacterium]